MRDVTKDIVAIVVVRGFLLVLLVAFVVGVTITTLSKPILTGVLTGVTATLGLLVWAFNRCESRVLNVLRRN